MQESKIRVTVTTPNKMNHKKCMHDAMNNIEQGMNNATSILHDGTFSNRMMRTGADDVALNAGQFNLDMITYDRELITAVYHSEWVFRRMIDQGARDMISKGIVITCDSDGDVIDKVYSKFNRCKSDLIYAITQARLYGGAASLMMVDDGEQDLSKPLVVKNIRKGSPIRFYTTDRWYNLEVNQGELVTNFNNIDYGTPKYYNFYLDENKHVKVHHSRVLRFVNRKPPRYIETRLSGWGISELEHIYQDMLAHANTKNSAASLVNKALLEIVKVQGMRAMMSGLSMGNPNSQQQLAGQMSALNNYRSINNLVLMDSEDSYEQHQYTLSGLSELLETQEDFIAGAAEMPKVLLYGDTKGGLTSDSPAEMIFYADIINGKQESELRNPINKLLRVLFSIVGADIPKNLDFEFESLVDTSDERKENQINSIINSCTTLMENGLMTHETALEEIINMAKKTGFGTKITERDIKLAKDNDNENEEMADNDESIDEEEQSVINELEKNTYDDEQEDVLNKNKKFFDKLKKRLKIKA